MTESQVAQTASKLVDFFQVLHGEHRNEASEAAMWRLGVGRLETELDMEVERKER